MLGILFDTAQIPVTLVPIKNVSIYLSDAFITHHIVVVGNSGKQYFKSLIINSFWTYLILKLVHIRVDINKYITSKAFAKTKEISQPVSSSFSNIIKIRLKISKKAEFNIPAIANILIDPFPRAYCSRILQKTFSAR